MRCALTVLAILTVAAPLAGQLAPTPRRIPLGFQGEIPLIWTVSGQGRLAKARIRVASEIGKELATWPDLIPVQTGSGEWQVWAWVKPTEGFKGGISGRLTLEAQLEWVRDGKAYPERVETVWRLDAPGEGWLPRAFLESEGPWALKSATQWGRGAQLALGLSGKAGIRRVRYQVVREQDERVLQAWTELPVQKGRDWKVSGDGAWPEGAAYLWVLAEGVDGRVQVLAQDVWIGASRGRTGAALGGPKDRKGNRLPGRGPVLLPTVQTPLSWPLTDWLTPLAADEPDGLAWDSSNRVATVTAGYRDEERNEVRLWPTDVGRPMSLSITGANQLGKPMYSVSYLLSDRANGATRLEDYADTAVAAAGTTGLPMGAETLEVGGQTAPVVFSAGVIEDPFGKPVAAGFGWAAHSIAGGVATLQSAKTWTASANAQPVVGLSAIRMAADLRQSLTNESITALGGNTGTSTARMDPATTTPYAFSLSSQDPTGRLLVSKGLGGRVAVSQPSVVSIASNARTYPTTALNFNDAAVVVPEWLDLDEGAVVNVDRSTGTPLGNVTLAAGWVSTGSISYDDSDDVNQPVKSITYHETVPPGSAAIRLGEVFSASASTQLNVSLTTAGPISATWVVEGATTVTILGGTWTGAATNRTLAFPFDNATLPSLPYRVSLVLTNTTTTPTEDPSALSATVDNIQISRNDGPVVLAPVDASLQTALVRGHTHFQYGVVDITNQGTCTVTMVTDPDGATVAEVKDPEGRTIYKVVNPTSDIYGTAFRDANGNALQFPTAVRGQLLQNLETTKKNLVTQYCFDREGHLRVIIPPLGFGVPTAGNPWGSRIDETHANSVLGLASGDVQGIRTMTVVKTSPPAVPYATYNVYDNSGHLVGSYNPDEGLTKFIVDQKGRVHYSQTEGQRATNRWTRTIYDGVLRVAAVGEVDDSNVTQSEAAGYSDPNLLDNAVTALATDQYRSRNRYDSYGYGTTTWNPKTSPALVGVRDLLPGVELWQAFPEGHLTETRDDRTVERYFYDQDGRIVIRWVAVLTPLRAGETLNDATTDPSLPDVSGTPSYKWRHYAIGVYYDFAGRVKRLIYPSGPTGQPLQVVYAYDELGRLYSVGTPQDRAYFARYVYHATGEVKAIVYGPGEGFAARRMLQDPQGWLRELSVQGR